MSQQINLYNPLLLKQQKLFSFNTMAQALGLILLGSLLFFAYAWYTTSSLQKQNEEAKRLHASSLARLQQLSAASNKRPASKMLQEEVARMEAQLNARQSVVALLERGELGNKQGFSEYFRALSRQTTDGVWLTAFGVTGAGEVAISGRTLKPELVPVFINRLKRETAMAGKTFATLEMRVPEPLPAAGGKTMPAPYIEFSLHNAEAGAAR
jgi:23S rRNA pseudoU1915 N3-methylase RlmH